MDLLRFNLFAMTFDLGRLQESRCRCYSLIGLSWSRLMLVGTCFENQI